MSDLDRIDKSMSNFGILLGIAFGAIITYIILKKDQAPAPVQVIPFQTIPETIPNQLNTQDIQYIYDQQSDIYNQIRLLNELLNRQDESLQQYNQTILQQYQNIPYTISYTINPELQQIALYLQNMSSQLEQTNLQLQQILKQQQQIAQQSTQQSKQSLQQSQQQPYQDGLLQYVKKQLLDNSKVLSQDKSQQESILQQSKHSQTDIQKQSQQSQQPQQDSLQTSDTTYKNNEKWAIQRGSDGRIKSLEIIRKALSKKA